MEFDGASRKMNDLLYLALTFGFLGASVALVFLFERLRGSK